MVGNRINARSPEHKIHSIKLKSVGSKFKANEKVMTDALVNSKGLAASTD